MSQANQKRATLNLDALHEKIAAGEIDTVVTVFPDTYGRLMGKRLGAEFFLASYEHGTHGCNYLLTVNIEMDPLPGFKLASWEQGYGDFALVPDMNSLRLLPWQQGAAMVICDVHHHDGTLVSEAPRSVLRRQLERLAGDALTCNIASELEFFLFEQSYRDAFAAGYTGLKPSSDYRIDYETMQTAGAEPIMRQLRRQMGPAGIPVESTKGEWGRGQHEANFVYSNPLSMADGHVAFKQGAKEIAAQHGKSITFMPKVFADEAGNSCHIHISLCRDGRNIFWDSQKNEPAAAFRHFLGGLMRYSRELCYFFAPTINAYKRYQPDSWAPTKMVWAEDNRTTGFRIVGDGQSFRIENRLPGGDANPYLAFAAMLVAGMAGIEEQLDCGEAYHGNAYVDAALPALPTTLRDAADLLGASALARRAFGDEVIDFYVHTARHEATAFAAGVTDWERLRYFERI